MLQCLRLDGVSSEERFRDLNLKERHNVKSPEISNPIKMSRNLFAQRATPFFVLSRSEEMSLHRLPQYLALFSARHE